MQRKIQAGMVINYPPASLLLMQTQYISCTNFDRKANDISEHIYPSALLPLSLSAIQYRL